MTETYWLQAATVDLLREWCLNREPRLLRKERLYACACCRRLWDLLTDERSRAAIVAAEAYADGELDKKALANVRRAAEHAARQASEPPMNSGASWTPADAAHATAYQQYVNDVFVVSTVRVLYATANYQLRTREEESHEQANLLRDIFGNPFRPVVFSADWRSSDAVAIARTMYESRDFGAMPILADALQDAGCDNEAILSHCRDTTATHVRGCWVCDLVLGKV